MAIKHAVVKAPGQKLFAVADWNANHTFLQTDIDHNLITNTHNLTSDLQPAWGNVTGKPATFPPDIHGNAAHSSVFITGPEVPANETDPIYSAWIAGPPNVSEFTNDAGYLIAEADPVFTAWDKDHADLSNVTANQHHTKYTDEEAQDAVGTILTDTATIDFTYDDVTPSITADVKPAGISHTAIADIGINTHAQIDTKITEYNAHDHSAADPTQVNHTNLTNVTSDQHHARQHAITAALDHTSTATPGQILKADANGLPIDATNTDGQVSAAVTASHARQHALNSAADHTGTITDAQHGVRTLANAHAHSNLSGIGANDHHAQAHTLASHSTKAHAELTNVTSGQHHAQLHAASHHVAGGDLVNHDSLTGFVANEHINHTGVSMIAGSGLSGGGTIAANRTFNLGALTGNWDAGGYEIRALKFYSDQATGTAPLIVLSTTKVTNLNVDYLDGYHASSSSTANTIALRDASGDINTRLFRSEYDTTNATCNYIMTQIDTATNNYIRPSTKAQLIASLNLMTKAGGTFTGAAVAADHGAAATDQIINVCYGTGAPPAANTTTIGSLFVKYTA